MAGLYVHIPFCKKACHYCNFYFSVSLKNKNDLIAALLKEIQLQKNYLPGQPVDTIYLGGGTPSILDETELRRVFQQLQGEFSISADAEITLEANPDDITPGQLLSWKQLGINRLSIGVQSFADEDLQWMNRAHNASQAKDCILLAQQAGFSNLSIDLIYGTPGLSDEQWHKNVATAIELNISHLSCYALTVEDGTALHQMIQQRKKQPVNTESQARHFVMLMNWLQQAGYEHYEISNFALPGSKSRHNSSYWQGLPYLGLGPSAHSFNGNSRQWNVSNNSLYITAVNQGRVPFEVELLTPVQRLNEFIMTSLRTSEGLDLETISRRFGAGVRQKIERGSEKYIQHSNVEVIGNSLLLTRNGKLFADGIAADLFFNEEDTALLENAVSLPAAEA